MKYITSFYFIFLHGNSGFRLRTLEFWVDNLNIDFLYPILSQDSSLLAELMASLGGHLQPAPYQFGLLTLRLLGKLGGKSRCFLQEPMDLQHSAFSDAYPEGARGEIFKCRLGQFEYPLPIELAVSILKSIPANQRTFVELSACRVQFNDKESVKNFLQQIHLEAFDLDTYNSDVSGEVIKRVVISAFDILRSGLSSIVQVHSADIEAFTNLSDPETCLLGDIDSSHNNKMLSSILDGLMHATLFDYLKTRATLILDGFLAYIIFVCVKYRRNIHGTDMSGEQIPSHDISDTSNGVAFEFRPFGCLQVDGPLSRTFNILIMNDLFARVLSEGADEACQSALLMVGEIKSLFYKMSCRFNSKNSDGAIDEEETSRNRDVRIIYENLLYKLCLETLSVSRVERFWLHEGIFKVMVVMGKDWSLQFQAHLLQVALYSINHSINEVARPGRDSLIFFIRICCFLHGTPIQMQGQIIQDDFDIPDDRPTGDNPSNMSEEDVILDHSSSASILIQQLSSVNSTVR
jgi:transformation/transcription domain-associated protein